MRHAGPTAESWRSVAAEPVCRFSRGSNRFPPASSRYGQGLSLVLRLQGEQAFLDVKAPREARQLPVGTDHPMAGGDDRDRVSPVGGYDRPCSARPSDLGRNLAVTPRLAGGNGQQRLPNPLLERCPSEVEGERECPPLSFEILAELVLSLNEQGMFGKLHTRAQRNALGVIAVPEDRGQPVIARDELELAHR